MSFRGSRKRCDGRKSCRDEGRRRTLTAIWLGYYQMTLSPSVLSLFLLERLISVSARRFGSTPAAAGWSVEYSRSDRKAPLTKMLPSVLSIIPPVIPFKLVKWPRIQQARRKAKQPNWVSERARREGLTRGFSGSVVKMSTQWFRFFIQTSQMAVISNLK